MEVAEKEEIKMKQQFSILLKQGYRADAPQKANNTTWKTNGSSGQNRVKIILPTAL